MVELTTTQKEKIKEHVEGYNSWADKQQNLNDHREHQKFFQKSLTEEKIDSLSEEEFYELYKNLWASNIWGNKDWYVKNKLLEPNGLANIKEELKKLLYGDEEISVRYDNFKTNIKGFGPSSISEILHFFSPKEFCLWNDKPKTVLPYLRIEILPKKFFKYNLQTGSEYKQCIDALKIIRDELESNGFENPDFIDLDCFLWYVFNNIEPNQVENIQEQIEPRASLKIEAHEDAELILLKLGKMLGYLPYLTLSDRSRIKEQDILNEILVEIPDCFGGRDKNSAREIDVIWFDESENPKICFEVEHTTNVSPGLQRLIQLKHFDVKFIIVAPEDRRNKFHNDIQKFPYRNVADRFKFISYEELVDLYDKVAEYHQLMEKLF
jgi:hypothetical protein